MMLLSHLSSLKLKSLLAEPCWAIVNLILAKLILISEVELARAEIGAEALVSYMESLNLVDKCSENCPDESRETTA